MRPGEPRRAAAPSPSCRPARRGQDDGRRARSRERLGVAVRDTDADVEAAAGHARSPTSSSTTASRRSASWSAARSRRALAEHDGVLALGGGAVLRPAAPRPRCDGPHGRVPRRRDRRRRAARIGFNRARPLLLGNPRAQWTQLMEARRPDLRADRHRARRHRRPHARPRSPRPCSAELRGPGAAAPMTLASTTDRRRPAGRPRRRLRRRHRPRRARRAARPARRRRPPRARRPPAGAALDRPRPCERDLAAAGVRAVPRRGAGRRGREDRRGARLRAGACSARPGFTRTDAVVGARRRRDDRPRRLRRGDLAARRAGGAGADDAARHGRRRRRRQDRDQHRRGQEPGRRVPPAARRALRPHRAADAAARRPRRRAGRGREVRLHRRPGDPRPHRGRPGRAAADWDVGRRCASSSSAASRSRRGSSPTDLRESGLREILNYGHTFGHAVEQVERFRWRHGEAVSVGHGVRRGARPAGRTGRRRRSPTGTARCSARSGCPLGYRGDRWPALLQAMRRDKKTRGDLLRFVVLADLARPVRLEGPDLSLLEQAYREVAVS